MDRAIIEATESFVQQRLSGESTGHDWWHAHRVRTTSLRIQANEGGNKEIIELAALLHDVGDRKVIGAKEDDPGIAREFLEQLSVDHIAIDGIMYVIENMSFSKSIGKADTEKPIELAVVQDADRFDALGAIGIARAFAFGGSRGRLLYDPSYQAQSFTSSEAYKSAEGSTLHHFDEKLFLLKDILNTETAKRLAEERDAYMHGFYDRFLAEWQGDI